MPSPRRVLGLGLIAPREPPDWTHRGHDGQPRPYARPARPRAHTGRDDVADPVGGNNHKLFRSSARFAGYLIFEKW